MKQNGHTISERATTPPPIRARAPGMPECLVCGKVTAKYREEAKPYCVDHIDRLDYAARLMAEFEAMDTFDRPGKPISSLPTYSEWVADGRPNPSGLVEPDYREARKSGRIVAA